MINNAMRKVLAKRDLFCWHCGDVNDLVIHHRKNRQMGGSKNLDIYENLMRVCAEYNSRMESDAKTAQEAIEFGHKLKSLQGFSTPVYDALQGVWMVLDAKGNKQETGEPGFLL